MILDTILKWSIARRWLVIIGAIAVTILGINTVSQMPLDVFPNFAPPEVEIQTEAPGLAPEEVESLVTLPIESAVNGTTGVTTVRSSSAVGISVVKVIFDWDTDIYQARQLVNERLQQAVNRLPDNVESPEITPLSSPINTILSYGLTLEPESSLDLMELRRLVDRELTNQILAVSGVSQVVVYGGEIRQYQVLVDPAKLKAFNVSLTDVTQATQAANTNAPGGFLLSRDQEILIRGIGRIESLEDLKRSVVTSRNGTPVLLSDLAQVQIGAALKMGDGSINGQPGIVILINKQPFADTPTVTQAVERVMENLAERSPFDTGEVNMIKTFRQGDFIDDSLENVRNALRDGIIIVSIVLLLFLMNWRTALISLSAIPLSLLIGLIIMNAFGFGINTMILGGLAVAIGSVVDDSIVDMENCYRGLRENRKLAKPKHPFEVVYDTSVEVRVSVLFSTVIIAVVFAPIFTLTGVEGRIFAPMGIAYLTSICASTFVALTLSPALCAILLAKQDLPEEDTWLSRLCQKLYHPLLIFSLKQPLLILLPSLAAFVTSLILFTNLGRIFLPEFQERALVNGFTLYPGVSLEMTNRAGIAIQESLRDHPYFDSIQLRSGRAPGDADAGSVNLGHLDVQISEMGMKDREKSVAILRSEFAKLPGVAPSIGGFISHRMDEVLSGVRSAIAIKIFGAELEQLREIGSQVREIMQNIPGVVDLIVEPQVPIKQIQIHFDRDAAARYSLTVGELSEIVETAFNGRVVSQVLEQQQLFDLLVWLQEDARNNLETIRNLLIDTPLGIKIPLAQVATIEYGTGPNTINRENVSRLLVVSANVYGRDLGSVVTDIQTEINQNIQLSNGYFIGYGGQFESEQRASQNLLIFGSLALIIIAVLMYFAVQSIPATIMIMLNLPLAITGGIFSVYLGGGILSVASMIGFITLFGVATRNGLLLVDNYNHKLAQGMALVKVVYEGSMERLVAILMTAFTSALGMIPLVIGSGAGKEILQPLAIVVLGGLFSSTALTLLVLPALYSQFGRWFKPKNNQSNLLIQESELNQN
jgi:CzcA family heavy metal efflux pump